MFKIYEKNHQKERYRIFMSVTNK